MEIFSSKLYSYYKKWFSYLNQALMLRNLKLLINNKWMLSKQTTLFAKLQKIQSQFGDYPVVQCYNTCMYTSNAESKGTGQKGSMSHTDRLT